MITIKAVMLKLILFVRCKEKGNELRKCLPPVNFLKRIFILEPLSAIPSLRGLHKPSNVYCSLFFLFGFVSQSKSCEEHKLFCLFFVCFYFKSPQFILFLISALIASRHDKSFVTSAYEAQGQGHICGSEPWHSSSCCSFSVCVEAPRL